MKTIKRFFAWLKQLGEICAPLAVADSHPWNCCCPICCELGFGYEPSRRQTRKDERPTTKVGSAGGPRHENARTD